MTYEVIASTETGTYAELTTAPSAEAALRKVKSQMAARILARTGRRVRSWRVETY